MKLHLIITILTIFHQQSHSILVCKTLNDYYHLDSQNCYDNPDDDSNVTRIIDRWGYKTEEHNITTDDGYILTVYKLIAAQGHHTPVVLGHGLPSNCLPFINRGNKSTAWPFLKNGYDVWLLNFRGSRYALQHVNLNVTDVAFWNFSFHEMAEFDLSAILRYIKFKTNNKSIYVGYSLGALVGHTYTALKPEESKKLLMGVIQLGSVAYIANLPISINIIHPILPKLQNLAEFIWSGELYRLPVFVENMKQNRIFMLLIALIMMTSSDFNAEQIDAQTLPVTVRMDTDSSAYKVIVHYSQLISSGKFRQYDYGEKGNLLQYGQKAPPDYELKKTAVPMVLFNAKNDKIASIKNARRIYKELPPHVRCGFYTIELKSFNHLDFVLARDLPKYLYPDMIKAANYLKDGICYRHRFE